MGPGSQAREMIFLTSKEKAVIRRYAIVCQLWREGDQDFLGLEYDMAAGCSIVGCNDRSARPTLSSSRSPSVHPRFDGNDPTSGWAWKSGFQPHRLGRAARPKVA